MDPYPADQMFREGMLTFREYVRLLGARLDNVRPLVHVEADDLAYVFAQIDELKVMHRQIFKDGKSRL
jgi:hypothetical protein